MVSHFWVPLRTPVFWLPYSASLTEHCESGGAVENCQVLSGSTFSVTAGCERIIP